MSRVLDNMPSSSSGDRCDMDQMPVSGARQQRCPYLIISDAGQASCQGRLYS